DGRQRRAEGNAQGCSGSQEPHCPCRLTLRCGHDGQTFERGSNIHDGQTSQQALFIRRACCRMVTLSGEDLSEKRARRGKHSLIPDLLPKCVTLFNQQARGRRLPLSEGDFPMESERKRFSTRGARFPCAHETLLC